MFIIDITNKMSNQTFDFRSILEQELKLLTREAKRENFAYVKNVKNRYKWQIPDKYVEIIINHAKFLLYEKIKGENKWH